MWDPITLIIYSSSFLIVWRSSVLGAVLPASESLVATEVIFGVSQSSSSAKL